MSSPFHDESPSDDVKDDIYLAEAQPNSVQPVTDTTQEEQTDSSVCGFFGSLFPVGGFLGTIFSICATVIGAGLLSLPSSFLDVGILMSSIYLVLVSAVNIYTMRMLAVLADKTGFYSIEELSILYLNTFASILLGVLRIIFCFGACVAYVISVEDLMTTILTNANNVPDFLLTTAGARVLTACFWALFMLTAVIPRQINTLRYVSAAGVGFIVLFVIVIVIHSAQNGLQQNPRPEVVLVQQGNSAMNGIGVFVFAFTNQFNSLDVFREMNRTTKSVKNYTLCTLISITLCGIIYILGGAFGYLDFGPNASKSLLQLYDPIGEPQILVCYIGVLIKLCASYALLFVGCRNALYHFIGWNPDTVAFWKHLLLVTGVSILILLCGLFIPNVNTVFGFVGGICGGSISFMYPAYLTMFSGTFTLKNVGIVNYVATYLVVAAGVFAIVVGTASTIYGVI